MELPSVVCQFFCCPFIYIYIYIYIFFFFFFFFFFNVVSVSRGLLATTSVRRVNKFVGRQRSALLLVINAFCLKIVGMKAERVEGRLCVSRIDSQRVPGNAFLSD